jgi:hypothetical protein
VNWLLTRIVVVGHRIRIEIVSWSGNLYSWISTYLLYQRHSLLRCTSYQQLLFKILLLFLSLLMKIHQVANCTIFSSSTWYSMVFTQCFQITKFIFVQCFNCVIKYIQICQISIYIPRNNSISTSLLPTWFSSCNSCNCIFSTCRTIVSCYSTSRSKCIRTSFCNFFLFLLFLLSELFMCFANFKRFYSIGITTSP